MKQIYLDFNATTPIDPRVAQAMRDVFKESHGNPSSAHWAGESARRLLERSRLQVAAMLGCESDEIVFTGGGSEANNLALKGLYFAHGSRPAHIITSAIEHPSIDAPTRFLERLGARITRIGVDGAGRVDPDDLRRAITRDTMLITLMHANNEVGTIQPIEECARIAREYGVPLHTDAAQSAGKIPTRVDALGVDLLTIAGHKLYAPKGVGALYVRRGVQLEALIHGGGQESGRRAGTESALLATGLGSACELGQDLAWTHRARELRDQLGNSLRDRLGDRVNLNGHPEHRLPNTLNMSFSGYKGAEMLAALDGIAVSTGSACHSGDTELSPVLRAMRVPEEIAVGAVRFSLGRSTTPEEIDETIDRLGTVLKG
ncbi:MAG: cysteine desulfurase family protein [Steroidobacteraceae bacterium]